MAHGNSHTKSIKKAQKESLLFQEISKLFLQMSLDDSRVRGLFVNRIKLSDDSSICTVFFYTPDGLADFETKRPILVLYKPSLRSALAKIIRTRYVPELVFRFDDQYEKQQRIDQLLDTIKGSRQS